MSAIAAYVDASQIILLSDGMRVNGKTEKAISLDTCKIHLLNSGCAILHVGYLGEPLRDIVKILKDHVDYPEQAAREMETAAGYFRQRWRAIETGEKPYFFLIIGYNKEGLPEAWEITNQGAILQTTGGRPHELRKHDSIDNWLFILPGDPAFKEKIDHYANQGRNIPDALYIAFSEVVGDMAETGKRVGGNIFLEILKSDS